MSKVTAGAIETKINLADCELSVKRAFHWLENKFRISSAACTVVMFSGGSMPKNGF
jgi:hypothetical protein